jgi:hypothetical protein
MKALVHGEKIEEFIMAIKCLQNTNNSKKLIMRMTMGGLYLCLASWSRFELMATIFFSVIDCPLGL